MLMPGRLTVVLSGCEAYATMHSLSPHTRSSFRASSHVSQQTSGNISLQRHCCKSQLGPDKNIDKVASSNQDNMVTEPHWYRMEKPSYTASCTSSVRPCLASPIA